MDCGRSGLGVRKGAWTEEEDALLRKCIEKHGEGKWGRVPMRAGLNRCRKSCRLRWLNYLRPNINRGNFHEDEVDLIFRLHRLLGNRKVFLWSLIAGRLPGRTANDVKNYWNSHLSKRVSSSSSSSKQTNGVVQSQIKTTKVIRPQPRTFSPSSKWLNGNGSSVIQTQLQQAKPLEDQESTVSWWKSLLAEEEETTKEMGTWPLTSWEGGPGDQDMADCFGVLEETDQRKSIEEDDLLMGGAFGDWEENMILDMDLFMLGL